MNFLSDKRSALDAQTEHLHKMLKIENRNFDRAIAKCLYSVYNETVE